MVRHKNRYIVVEIKELHGNKSTSLDIHPMALTNGIFGTVQHLHGDFGVAAIRAGFVAKYCNPLTKIAVMRARHGPHKLVASSIPFVNHIGNHQVHLGILYMGATLKHCYNFIINYQKIKFDEYCFHVKTSAEKAELKKAMTIDVSGVLKT